MKKTTLSRRPRGRYVDVKTKRAVNDLPQTLAVIVAEVKGAGVRVLDVVDGSIARITEKLTVHNHSKIPCLSTN